jgi:hypothetical protein
MLGISALILGGLHSCTGTESAVISNENIGRNAQAINLFPEQSFAYDNTGKLSLNEAFKQSGYVIRTAHLKQIENSNGRSIKPFYIYQVNEGSFNKSLDTTKNKFPVLFLSRKELFKGKVLQDSVYLFLAPLQQYHVLQENIGIAYEWIDAAPFIGRQIQ